MPRSSASLSCFARMPLDELPSVTRAEFGSGRTGEVLLPTAAEHRSATIRAPARRRRLRLRHSASSAAKTHRHR